MPRIKESIDQRRTFAIISHPDAGKTTLTEKLLLFGGAIQMAGAVKARGNARRSHSDWMKVERERGISVASSVMTFEYKKHIFNLLDTPGHEDFSEDTYRTLTAVDSVIMVIDGAKGIEQQTKKLFEVCRLRDMPIITFVNKMDRDVREPIEIIDEIEQTLALDVTPATWPIGMGRDFLGCYNMIDEQLILLSKGKTGVSLSNSDEKIIEKCHGLEDPKLDELLPDFAVKRLRDEVEMIRGLCPKFNLQEYKDGSLTPIYFGSAINNFGVQELLAGIRNYAPCPRPQSAEGRKVNPEEQKVSGFVFKIQANMDPKHRDRIAFFRLSSGHFKKGMKLKHIRSDKIITLSNPILFLARDRETAQEAFAGDIIGIPNHGNLRIGDTLTEGELIKFTGVPSFAPELLKTVRPTDPLKAKHLGKALQQLAEEGAARVFKRRIGSDWIVGVIGQLQFDVMADRIRTEYEVPVIFEATSLYTARWVTAADKLKLKKFINANEVAIATDHDDDIVFLARNAWHLERAIEDYADIQFIKIKEHIQK